MRVPQAILDARKQLAEDREKLHQQHTSGTRGIQVGARLSDVFDARILEIYENALFELGEEGPGGLLGETALVPHGGYGRRDVAPFSDVDLLLLYRPSAIRRVAVLAKHIVKDVSDLGLSLGFSIRTPSEACSFGRKDPVIFTSQAEARFLAGSVRLFRKFMHRFSQQTKLRKQRLTNRIVAERSDERRKHGETIYVLEPNVKRSKGCLRDVHLLRWVGFACYGESDPRTLRLLDYLTPDDERTVRRAHEFLLRVRNELHFNAGRSFDVLNRDEQLRIAELWNYEGIDGLLPVEVFMQELFERTKKVSDIVEHFIANTRRRSVASRIFAPLVTKRLEDNYRIGPVHISVNRRGRQTLHDNLDEVLHLMDLANRYDRRIDHTVWDEIRTDLLTSEQTKTTRHTAQHFLSLLGETPRLGSLLRRLHEVGVLEKLIVGMDHARSLLQFNKSHRYTVDEHSIRAVEEATELVTTETLLGQTYKSIKDRDILHLALLCHDMGKGFDEDHSEVGKRMARETAARLHLSPHQSEMLEFLVHKHLIMSHLAFRRDTTDESIILEFSRQVGSPESLRMLFVLTACDIASVGRRFLNPWKVDLLSDVYRRAMHHVSGGGQTPTDQLASQKRRETVRQLLGGQVAGSKTSDWFGKQIDGLPSAYIMETQPELIVEDLKRIRAMQPDATCAWGRYHEQRAITEYTIATREISAEGIFHRLTGALSTQRLEILSGQIHTLSDEFVLDRFCIQDLDHAGPPTDSRLESVARALERSVESPIDEEPKFRKTWSQSTSEATQFEILPTRVVIDNVSSPDRTIIDVFTHDRVGLLYKISRAIFELDLSVQFAKIGTYLEQVVDVFYVVEKSGGKVHGEQRIEEIKDTLLENIEEFLNIDDPVA